MQSTATSIKYCHACGQSIDSRAESDQSAVAVNPRCSRTAPPAPSHPAARTESPRRCLPFSSVAWAFTSFTLAVPAKASSIWSFSGHSSPALTGLIEGIVYIASSDADFAAKYG